MTFQISERATIMAAEAQISADLSGEVVILNLNSGVYYGLDAVGARIWELIQAPKTVREIRAVLLDEYQVELERCERDLFALLQNLAAKGLIEVKNGASA